MEPETRRELIEGMDAHMRGVFEGMGPEEQHRLLDWRLFVARRDAAEGALAGWERRAPIPREVATFVGHAVERLADREYPVVWVGEAGMTAEELLEMQQTNDELPEWMRVEPGEGRGKPASPSPPSNGSWVGAGMPSWWCPPRTCSGSGKGSWRSS